MRRIRLDLKADAGRDAFLRLAAEADVVIESFRPGRRRPAGHRLRGRAGRQPRDRLLLDLRATARTGPARSGPATTSTTSPSAATWTAPAGAPTAGRRCPGATIADSAGGGMQAVMGILAALVQRQVDRRGPAPRRGRGRRRARPHVALRRAEPGHRRPARPPPRPADRPLRLLRPLRGGDGGWLSVAAIEPHFWRNLCWPARPRRVRRRARPTTPARTRSGRRSGPGSRRGPGTSGPPSWARPTPASPRC